MLEEAIETSISVFPLPSPFEQHVGRSRATAHLASALYFFGYDRGAYFALSVLQKRKYAPQRAVLFIQVTVLPPNTPKPNLAGCSRNALRPEERVMWHRC